MEAVVMIHSGLKIRYNIGLGSSVIPRTFRPMHHPTSAANEAYMPLADTLQPITIGSADATAPKADPTDRSEDESYRGHCARTPRARRPLSGASQRRVRRRPNLYQPGG